MIYILVIKIISLFNKIIFFFILKKKLLYTEYTRTVKPCIWFPRSWCLKSNLHSNAIISLIYKSKETKCFASTKLYSKYSELFCDKKEFPEKLEFKLPAIKTGNNNVL